MSELPEIALRVIACISPENGVEAVQFLGGFHRRGKQLLLASRAVGLAFDDDLGGVIDPASPV